MEKVIINIIAKDDIKYKNLSACAKLIYSFTLSGSGINKTGVAVNQNIEDIEFIENQIKEKYGFRESTLKKAIRELKNKRVIEHKAVLDIEDD